MTPPHGRTSASAGEVSSSSVESVAVLPRRGDAAGNMAGEYSVALPDGRIQHVR